MAEHLTSEQLARTGWRFHFNTDTIRGRSNVSIKEIKFIFYF